MCGCGRLVDNRCRVLYLRTLKVSSKQGRQPGRDSLSAQPNFATMDGARATSIVPPATQTAGGSGAAQRCNQLQLLLAIGAGFDE